MPRADDANFFGALLFFLVFAYYWITLEPFVSRGDLSFSAPSAAASNTFNQIVGLALFGIVLLKALMSPARANIAQPWGLLVLLLLWLLFTSAIADFPSLALRRLVLVIVTVVCASSLLMMPRSHHQFARVLAWSIVVVVGLSYFGVLALPALSVHQTTDVSEQALAGAWRGHFLHKNDASSGMIVAIFVGLYGQKSWWRLGGLLLTVLAAIFLIKAGSKNTLGLLPVVLVLAWLLERAPRLGTMTAVLGVLAFNFVAIGSSLWPAMNNALAAFGFDASFTDRVDIWKLAIDAIAERPWTGYGLQSFWQTENLVYSGGQIETWAINASHAHNGYLEIWLAAGIPALLLTLMWLLVLPPLHAAKAFNSGNDTSLTRLFTRIWLYVMFANALESTFFSNSGPLWFTLLLAVFGLRNQAKANLIVASNR
jgi:O-antigen ligase